MGTRVTGLPSALLLASREYKFKLLEDVKLIIPKSGKYCDLAPDVFTEDDGEFHIFHNGVLFVPAITKVLLGTKKYPALEDNQALALLAIQEQEDTVVIFGSIVEFEDD